MITQFDAEWDTRISNQQWRNKKDEVFNLSEMSELYIKKCLSLMNDYWLNSKQQEHYLTLGPDLDQDGLLAKKVKRKLLRADVQINALKEELLKRKLAA